MTLLGFVVILGLIALSVCIINSMIRPSIEWHITYDVHIPWISNAAKPLSWAIATLEYILIIIVLKLVVIGVCWLLTVGNTIILW